MELPPDEKPPGAPDWMVTFAHLMSLLLTFFVLLLSFSNMEIVKFRTMAGSVRNALGLKSEIALSDLPTGEKLLPYKSPKEGKGETEDDHKDKASKRVVTKRAISKLRAMLEENEATADGVVKASDRGVVLELRGDLVFDSCKTDLKPASQPILAALAEFINSVPGQVEVQGHTDNVPIKNSVFPSNWELSAGRAAKTVRFLTAKGVAPTRFMAQGFADTRPLDTNTTPEGRARNRRVQFEFLIDSEAADNSVDFEQLDLDLTRRGSGA